MKNASACAEAFEFSSLENRRQNLSPSLTEVHIQIGKIADARIERTGRGA